MRFRLILLFISYFFFHQMINAAENKDSIANLLSKAPNRIEKLLEISKSYRDTSFDKAAYYANQALSEAQAKGDLSLQGMALGSLASLSVVKGDPLNVSVSKYESALELFKKAGDKEKEARVINNIGLLYDQAGRFKEALDYYMNALKIYKEINFKTGIGEATNNIGVIYDILNEHDLSIKYYQESVEIAKELGDVLGVTMSLINVGYVEIRRGNIEKGLKIVNEVIEIKRSIGDSTGIAMAYNNLSEVYFGLNNLPEAVNYVEKAILINASLGKHERLASNYYNLAWIYDEMKLNQKAIQAALKAIDIAQKYYDAALKIKVVALLTDLYANENNFKKAYEYSVQYITLYDSLESARKIKDVQSLKTQFETEKKEQELLLEKEQRALAEASAEKSKAISQRKTTQLVASATVGGLLLVLSFLFFKSARNRKKTNELLERKNNAIEEQKLLLEEKHKEITDSIQYAKRIQTALLTSDNYWDQISKENFVLLQPKDVVSGDFFWAYEAETKEGPIAIWCAADCTGHGVPGAFMSMLGIGFLNEIVIENGHTNASEILNQLRDKIIRAMEQKSTDIQQRDGMDIALCVWKKNKMTLEFSGANNPLWILRKQNSGYELIEIKADKMPVGKHSESISPFQLHTISLQKEDTLYVFSDGYADQFGGEHGKKFKYAQFKQLLTDIQPLDLKSQKNKIEERFNNWKGNLEQIDDVCIIGVRINLR